MSTVKVAPLVEAYEKQLFDFLSEDKILHVFTIFDLRFLRDKTEVWAALENERIVGYLLEFDFHKGSILNFHAYRFVDA